MKITLGALRQMLLREIGPYPGKAEGPRHLSPDVMDIEQRPENNAPPVDTADDPEGMPEHLREPDNSLEDCYGPVPPVADNPYLSPHNDPWARDVLPRRTPT